MVGYAPSANSRPPRPYTRPRPGSAPTRIATPLALYLILAGCLGPRAPLDATRTAQRWIAAVAARDSMTARRFAIGRFPGPSFQGGGVLRAGPVVPLSSRLLDSLAVASDAAQRQATLDFGGAGEETADSLWLRAEAAARRAALFRDARLAAAASEARRHRGPGNSGSPSLLRACRVRIRVRWGGPLVGPAPVDREHVLRMVAAPAGPWVVYSWLARDRDPAEAPF